MEMFATLLCMISMFTGLFFVIALIINRVKRKPKKKRYSRGVLISIIVFIASIVLFAVFETPESKEKYEQQRIERQEQAEKEKEEKKQTEREQAEKEKAKKEDSKKEVVEKEKNKEDSSTKKSSSNEDTTKTKEIETNYLKQLKVRNNPVVNGTGTEKIGTYGFVKAEKELAQQVSEQEYLDFCNDVVRDSGYNWFTVVFSDGTGITFTSSIPETGTYGVIDETYCIVQPIDYININSDNTISLFDATQY